MNLKLIAFCIVISFSSSIRAQPKLIPQSKLNSKFGEIKPEDFDPKSPAIDSGSNAVVLLDLGSTDFEGNTNGYFSLIFTLHERIFIKSRNAFDEATIKVPLYQGASQYADQFNDLEASTFNLENGRIVETKLDKNSIFKEKYNKEYVSLKFSLPNIKEGCIIEYKYTIKTPFNRNDIRTWYFQSENPVLWSEYRVTIPPIYNYATIRQGYVPFAIDTTGSFFKSYTIIEAGDASSSSEVYRLSGDSRWAWWAAKDVPAFKADSYISSSKNYISKIKFQLISIKYSESHIVPVVKDWITTVDDLLKDEDFGKYLFDGTSWCHDDLKKICAGADGLIKAKRIFEYIRDNFTCTDDDAKYLSQSLKKTYQSKKGNVADINLLLTAILSDQGFEVHPVILSTKDNGKAQEASAFLYQYNYVISRVKINDVYYLLDASVNRMGFGKLSENCYNGSGRLIDKMPYLIPLSPDSLSETKSTLIFISNDQDSHTLIGSATSSLGYFESINVRNKIAKEKLENFNKEELKSFPSDFEMSNVVIDSLNIYDEPVAIKNEFKFKFDEDIVYFNPMLNEEKKINPFAAEKRTYPVEMPYKTNEVYIFNMGVPDGYKIDEIPKSARITLNGEEGMFEYLIVSSGSMIQFRAKLSINKTTFMPEDYQTLRDFYSYVVKKEAEQIVFKKIK
ncbi:MAG TPA: DUF3858 domain-containing protein [Puia sp.]|nr:DUF3858 domain-containing protein [Puia sp.]